MRGIIYSDEAPPKGGTGLKIYRALKQAGYFVKDLHYNPNLWGRGQEMGWGTWACSIDGPDRQECYCGVHEGAVYLQGLTAPYSAVYI